MVALEEKLEDHKSQCDLSSGDHECLCQTLWQAIQQVLIFQSGPKWWTYRCHEIELIFPLRQRRTGKRWKARQYCRINVQLKFGSMPQRQTTMPKYLLVYSVSTWDPHHYILNKPGLEVLFLFKLSLNVDV